MTAAHGHAIRAARAHIETRVLEPDSMHVTAPVPTSICTEDNVSIKPSTNVVLPSRQCNTLAANIFRWEFKQNDHGIVVVTSTKYKLKDRPRRTRSAKTMKPVTPHMAYAVRLGRWATRRHTPNRNPRYSKQPTFPKNQRLSHNALSRQIRVASTQTNKSLRHPIVPSNATVYPPKTLNQMIALAPHAVACTCIDWAARAFGSNSANLFATKGCKHMIFVDAQMKQTHLRAMVNGPHATHAQKAYFAWEEWAQTPP